MTLVARGNASRIGARGSARRRRRRRSRAAGRAGHGGCGARALAARPRRAHRPAARRAHGHRVALLPKLPSDLVEHACSWSIRCWPPAAARSRPSTCCEEAGARDIRLICIVAAPEGIAAVEAAHPAVADLHSRRRSRAERAEVHPARPRGLRRSPVWHDLEPTRRTATGSARADTVVDGAHAHRAEPDSVRGYRLDEMMGRVDFRRGHLPAAHRRAAVAVNRPADGRDARVVHRSRRDAAVDAGRAQHRDDRRVAARTAVAAGVLGFGPHHGGDVGRCLQLLDDGLALARTGRSLAAAAAELVDRWSPPTKSRRPASATGITRSIRARRGCCRSRTSSKSITSTRSSSARSSTRSARASVADGPAAADQHRRRHRRRLRRHRPAARGRRRAADHLARARAWPRTRSKNRSRSADARDRSRRARLRRAERAAAAGETEVIRGWDLYRLHIRLGAWLSW